MFISIVNRVSKNTIKLGYGVEIINQENKNEHTKLPASFSKVFKTRYFISFQKRERNKSRSRITSALKEKYFIWHNREIQSLKSENSILGEDIDTTFLEIFRKQCFFSEEL